MRYDAIEIIQTQIKDGDQFGNITNVGGNGSIEGVVRNIKSEKIREWKEIKIVERTS